MKEKFKPINFTVHSFMTSVLELGGSELLVYAVIHSFTRGSEGLYWGTKSYIARVCGLSERTVGRAVAHLEEMGMIEECTVGGRTGYKCAEVEWLERSAIEIEGPPNNAEQGLPSKVCMDNTGVRPTQLLAEEAPRAKYCFHDVGREGVVYMTAEQYSRLLTLVSSEALHAYIRRLELLILDKGYRCNTPYQTIKRWIYKDAAL